MSSSTGISTWDILWSDEPKLFGRAQTLSRYRSFNISKDNCLLWKELTGVFQPLKKERTRPECKVEGKKNTENFSSLFCLFILYNISIIISIKNSAVIRKYHRWIIKWGEASTIYKQRRKCLREAILHTHAPHTTTQGLAFLCETTRS